MSPIRKFVGLALSILALFTVASPSVAHDTAAESANKKVVLDFYRALNDADAAGAMKERIQGIAEKYLSPDYTQHSDTFANLPGPGSARDRLVRMFQDRPAMKGATKPKTVAVMAEGDLVMMLTAREMLDPNTGSVKQAYIFNMFRVKNGQLVEHWDSPQPTGSGPGMPPPATTPSG